MKEWKKKGYLCSRTAGSHGLFDIYCLPLNPDWPVIGVQCKRVETNADARRLIDKFRDHPPLLLSKHLHQVLEVWVKKDKKVVGVEL